MRRHGWVERFDDAAGFGYIHAVQEHSEALDTYFFHCTRLNDGSRTVQTGARVSFEVIAGHLGTWEAIDIEVVGHNEQLVPSAQDGQVACPVCSGPIDGPSGSYDICATCGWEDDPVQAEDPDYVGGANTMSLSVARDDWARRQATQSE